MVKDMSGSVFGQLTVIKRGQNNNRGDAQWYCQCDCGTSDVLVRAHALRSGHTKSCGCRESSGPVMLVEKLCPRCQIVKPRTEYYRTQRGMLKNTMCKPCTMLDRKENPNPNDPLHKHDWWLRSTYGISLNDYYDILARQGGKCPICGTTTPTRGHTWFDVDHDHITGVVRGILCSECNNGIGKLKDDPGRLARAIAYLDQETIRQCAFE